MTQPERDVAARLERRSLGLSMIGNIFMGCAGIVAGILAHVTNQMGPIECDFEKGVANGSNEALRVVARIMKRLR